MSKQNPNELSVENCLETHPNFRVTCLNCGSERVYFENTLGYSPESGGWGEVSLICADCLTQTDLISN